MLALYHRSQVEGALWRLRAGSHARRIPPPEFSTRLRLWMKELGAAGKLGADREDGAIALYSVLDAVLLWIALELEELALPKHIVVEHACALRSRVARTLSIADKPATERAILVVIGSSVSAYAPHSGHARVEVSWPNELHQLLRDSAANKIVVLALHQNAEQLALLLADAPVIKRGPLRK